MPPDKAPPQHRRNRNPNMRSSIYLGTDGYWHGRVTVGIRDDGKPDRRHVMGKTRSEIAEKVRALERDRDKGAMRKAGPKWTVASWLSFWIENVAAPPHVAENTHAGYKVDVSKHLIPGIGAHRLDRLAPEHLEKLYARMQGDGLSAGTAHHVHRTVRAALNVAVRRGHLSRNPVLLARAPALDEDDVEPYDVSEIQRLLEAAARHRNGARWALALALGLRQGEALGLKWDCVDLDKGTIRIRRSRLRPKYAHGCGDTCGHVPGLCPQRVNIREETGGVKSKAGRRTVGLPPQLMALLAAHLAEQERERAIAGQLWREGGWVFATATGQPLIPITDYHEWKRLLKEAGLRESRLHDARHTAATVLLALRQPTPTVMSLMGWSSESMAARYQHVTDTIRTQVANQVGDLIWQAGTSDSAQASTVLVRGDSLATVLTFAEVQAQQVSGRDASAGAELLAAIADLQASLEASAASSRTSNETKTETRRPEDR